MASPTLLPMPPISAAVPAFEIDTEVDGPTIHVTVTFQPVPTGFAWASLEASGVLERLVGLVPAVQIGEDDRPKPDSELVLIPLNRRKEGVYKGAAEVQEGRWAVVAWPVEPGFGSETNPGSPATQLVSVGGPPAWVWLALGGAGAAVIAGLSLREPSGANAVGVIRRWKKSEKGG